MFGYILPNKKELSDKDEKVYKGYYCGLCHALKERVGLKRQFILQYDMTFLSLLLSGLYEPPEKETEFRCLIHPIGKRTAVSSEITEYVADMNLLLGYYNLYDNYLDERKIGAKKIADSLEPKIAELRKKYPRQTEAVSKAVDQIDEAEASKEENLSLVANLFGLMMSEIFAYKKDDVWTEDLRKIGFYIGKFLYLMDAYEDIENDKKKKLYNPLLISKAYKKDCFETYIRQLLTTQLSEIATIFERMPILKNADIIRNILYSGAWMKYDVIQMKRHMGTVDNDTSTSLV